MPLLLLACAPGTDTGPSAPVGVVDGIGVVSLEVRPAELVVPTGPSGGAPARFEAWATLDNGNYTRLDNVGWSVSNSTTGGMAEDGTFTPDTNGGVTYVTAEIDDVAANALVTVVYTDQIVTEAVDPTLFVGTEASHPGLWTYPQDNVNFPRNTPGITFQWADVGASMARLRFRSTVTDLTVYTSGTSWTADELTWQLIAGTNAGGSVVAELALLVGAEIWLDDPRTLNVNRMDGEGTIYYWSTSAAGVRTVAYGQPSVDYFTPATAGVSCVGCHVVEGGKLAFTYDGGNGNLGLKNLSDQSDIIPYGTGQIGNFKTFSPDGRYLLVADNGALRLYDAITGAYLYDVAVGDTATHPDWSPDGTAVVYTQTGYHSADWSFTNGDLYVMDYLGDGQFGTPRLIYDAPDPYIAYYPTWSPDSRWIAFCLSTEDSYDDASANVYVVNDLGDAPIALTSANLTDGITNSLPRWGPLPDDDVLWLAFSSKRAYGNYTAGNPQIWVTGFDPARASRGEDPSWPAFWLPGQDIAQNNHLPYWTD